MNSVIERLEAGGGRPAKDNVIKAAAARIGCEVELLQAIVNVESQGEAYDTKGRLHLLPEAHQFWKHLPPDLHAEAQARGLARPRWNKKVQYKGLGSKGSDARWDRLRAMATLDETAALKSCSWGSAQVMGFNHRMCGYGTVQDFVLAMAATEDAQIEALVAYLEASGLKDELRHKDVLAIARRYNGAGQAEYYAGLISAEYRRLTGHDVEVSNPVRAKGLRLGSKGYRVRALQDRLKSLGYQVRVDGDFGPATKRAVVGFQSDHGIAVDGVVGPETEAALDRAVPIEQPDRENATVEDLRERDSRIVKNADHIETATKVGGGVVVATKTVEETGFLDKIQDWLGHGEAVRTVITMAQDLISFASDHWWLLLPLAIGGIWYWTRKVKAARLEDHREGKTV